MRDLTITDLLRLTRRELCDLAALITADLPGYRRQPEKLAQALLTLRNIRWVLARRDFSP